MSMYDVVLDTLKARGVSIKQIAELVYELQVTYTPSIEFALCERSVKRVLTKREVQHLVLTGIAMDIFAEKNMFPEPLQQIIAQDAPLFGVDENIALGIANVYGTIGATSFGYLDKTKPGILRKLDTKGEQVHTFLDDIVAALAAAAAARVAHNIPEQEECYEL